MGRRQPRHRELRRPLPRDPVQPHETADRRDRGPGRGTHRQSRKDEAGAVCLEAESKGREEGLEPGKIELAERMLLLVERSIDDLSDAGRLVTDAVLLCLRRVPDEFPDEDLVLRQRGLRSTLCGRSRG